MTSSMFNFDFYVQHNGERLKRWNLLASSRTLEYSLDIEKGNLNQPWEFHETVNGRVSSQKSDVERRQLSNQNECWEAATRMRNAFCFYIWHVLRHHHHHIQIEFISVMQRRRRRTRETTDIRAVLCVFWQPTVKMKTEIVHSFVSYLYLESILFLLFPELGTGLIRVFKFTSLEPKQKTTSRVVLRIFATFNIWYLKTFNFNPTKCQEKVSDSLFIPVTHTIALATSFSVLSTRSVSDPFE